MEHSQVFPHYMTHPKLRLESSAQNILGTIKCRRILIFIFSLTHVSTGDCYRFRAVDSESAVRWREAVREAMRPKSKDLMKFE